MPTSKRSSATDGICSSRRGSRCRRDWCESARAVMPPMSRSPRCSDPVKSFAPVISILAVDDPANGFTLPRRFGRCGVHQGGSRVCATEYHGRLPPGKNVAAVLIDLDGTLAIPRVKSVSRSRRTARGFRIAPLRQGGSRRAHRKGRSRAHRTGARPARRGGASIRKSVVEQIPRPLPRDRRDRCQALPGRPRGHRGCVAPRDASSPSSPTSRGPTANDCSPTSMSQRSSMRWSRATTASRASPRATC